VTALIPTQKIKTDSHFENFEEDGVIGTVLAFRLLKKFHKKKQLHLSSLFKKQTSSAIVCSD